MAYYRSKYYGVEASVDAVNRESADEQLQWLLKDKTPCFCQTCREDYEQKYSIRLQSVYTPQTKCTNTQSISSTRFV